jgi:hypothetical protein
MAFRIAKDEAQRLLHRRLGRTAASAGSTTRAKCSEINRPKRP